MLVGTAVRLAVPRQGVGSWEVCLPTQHFSSCDNSRFSCGEVLAAFAAAVTLAASLGCEETEETCEQAALLQVTGKSGGHSLWPFPSLAEHAAERGADLEEGRLDEVHKVHKDMEALALQKLAEMENTQNLSDYNLTREDFGLSNTTMTLLHSVLTEMQSLLAQINASHLADEQLLLDLAEGFAQCNSDLSARQLQSQNLSTLVRGASSSHDGCRTLEQTLSGQNGTDWLTYLNKGNEALPQDVKDCMQAYLDGYNPQTAEHLQVMIDCAATISSFFASFEPSMVTLKDTYFSSLHAVNNRSEECRVEQSTLESHFCEYRQQLTDSCDAIDTCYQNVNQTWLQLLATIAASDSRREASYTAAKKVICYIQLLQSNLTQAAVQACQDLVVDTSGLAVHIPDPAAKQVCDSSPVADFPCETAWVQSEYLDKSWYTGNPQIAPDTCPGPQRRSQPATIAAWDFGSCAIVENASLIPSKLWCVGDNNYGTTGGRSSSPPYGNQVDLGRNRTARAVYSALNSAHVCALLDTEDLKCWGWNAHGQLGLGDASDRGRSHDGSGMGDQLPSVDVGADRKVVGVAVGVFHTCGVLADRSMKCWGYGQHGRLGFMPDAGGYGNNNNKAGDAPGEMGDFLPTLDFGGEPVLDVSAGQEHTCAILQNNSNGAQLTCWGSNSYGQLGRGSAIASTANHPLVEPVNLGTGLHAVQVAAGNDHACALLSTGRVKCWGRNDYGQLGSGSTTDVGRLAADMGDNLPAVDLGTSEGAPLNAIYIAGGRYHACAILEGGGVKCWGYLTDASNSAASIGDGPNEMGDHLPFIDLGVGRTAVEVAGGSRHNCARLDDDTLHCWGYVPQDWANDEVEEKRLERLNVYQSDKRRLWRRLLEASGGSGLASSDAPLRKSCVERDFKISDFHHFIIPAFRQTEQVTVRVIEGTRQGLVQMYTKSGSKTLFEGEQGSGAVVPLKTHLEQPADETSAMQLGTLLGGRSADSELASVNLVTLAAETRAAGFWGLAQSLQSLEASHGNFTSSFPELVRQLQGAADELLQDQQQAADLLRRRAEERRACNDHLQERLRHTVAEALGAASPVVQHAETVRSCRSQGKSPNPCTKTVGAPPGPAQCAKTYLSCGSSTDCSESEEKLEECETWAIVASQGPEAIGEAWPWHRARRRATWNRGKQSDTNSSCEPARGGFQKHFCELQVNLTSTCLAHDNCWEKAESAWLHSHANIAGKVSKRKVAFEAVKRMACHLGDLSQPPADCDNLVLDPVPHISTPDDSGKEACELMACLSLSDSKLSGTVRQDQRAAKDDCWQWIQADIHEMLVGFVDSCEDENTAAASGSLGNAAAQNAETHCHLRGVGFNASADAGKSWISQDPADPHGRLGQNSSARDLNAMLQITSRREALGKRSQMTQDLCESIARAMVSSKMQLSKHLVMYICGVLPEIGDFPNLASGCFAFPTDDLLGKFLRSHGQKKMDPDFALKLLKGFFFPKVRDSCEVQGVVTTLRGFSYQGCAGGLRVDTACSPWQKVSSTHVGESEIFTIGVLLGEDEGHGNPSGIGGLWEKEKKEKKAKKDLKPEQQEEEEELELIADSEEVSKQSYRCYLSGCFIDDSRRSDGKCDCEQCEDEPGLSCESCGGCPSLCTDSPADCFLLRQNFTCDDGCIVPAGKVDNNKCDCSNCEDESQFTCEACHPWFNACHAECGRKESDFIFSFEECQKVESIVPDATSAPAGFAWTIPINFYFCDDPTNGGVNVSSQVTSQMLQDQIRQLNRDFSGQEVCQLDPLYEVAQADVQVQFWLEGITTIVDSQCSACGAKKIRDNPTLSNVITQIPGKPLSRENGKIKVVICPLEARGFLGLAGLPGSPYANRPSFNDDYRAVAVDPGALTGGNLSAYNQGKTLTRMMGHYLGLRNTFEKGCDQTVEGDFVNDTALEESPNLGNCSSSRQSCGSGDPVHNYMDLSDDACRCSFTAGQARRMWYFMREFQPDLLIPSRTTTTTTTINFVAITGALDETETQEVKSVLGSLLNNIVVPGNPDSDVGNATNDSNASNVSIDSNSSGSDGSASILATLPINTSGGEVLQVTVLDPKRVAKNTTVSIPSESGGTVAVTGNALQKVAEATGSDLVVLSSSKLKANNSAELAQKSNAEVESLLTLSFRDESGTTIEAGNLPEPIDFTIPTTDPDVECLTWDEDLQEWTNDGLETLEDPPEGFLSCRTFHLSLFGSGCPRPGASKREQTRPSRLGCINRFTTTTTTRAPTSEVLTEDVANGSTSIPVADVGIFRIGISVYISDTAGSEVRTVINITSGVGLVEGSSAFSRRQTPGTLFLNSPLTNQYLVNRSAVIVISTATAASGQVVPHIVLANFREANATDSQAVNYSQFFECLVPLPASVTSDSWTPCFNAAQRNRVLDLLRTVANITLADILADGGWAIPTDYWLNMVCDCPNCEDEEELLNLGLSQLPDSFRGLTGKFGCDQCGGCPTVCGESVDCNPDDSGLLSECAAVAERDNWDLDALFDCGPVGYRVPAEYVNDSQCDCPDCRDEANYTCETCGYCPLVCGTWAECGENATFDLAAECSNADLQWSALSGYKTCNNGWTIPIEYWDDDSYCDCPDCEDESFSCEVCGGCPSPFMPVFVDESFPGTSISNTSACGQPFECNWISIGDSIVPECQLYAAEYMAPADIISCNSSDPNTFNTSREWLNDGFCDCPNCEDEDNYTCSSCLGGCPEKCGESRPCDEGPNFKACRWLKDSPFYLSAANIWAYSADLDPILGTYGYGDPFSSKEQNASRLRQCSNGWTIEETAVNDGQRCDCPNCEDEVNLTVENCSFEPAFCGDSVVCDGSLTDLNDQQLCPAWYGFINESLTFVCDNGWRIPFVFQNDNVCDCRDCDDEANVTCESCGACPFRCGDYTNCVAGQSWLYGSDERTKPATSTTVTTSTAIPSTSSTTAATASTTGEFTASTTATSATGESTTSSTMAPSTSTTIPSTSTTMGVTSTRAASTTSVAAVVSPRSTTEFQESPPSDPTNSRDPGRGYYSRPRGTGQRRGQQRHGRGGHFGRGRHVHRLRRWVKSGLGSDGRRLEMQHLLAMARMEGPRREHPKKERARMSLVSWGIVKKWVDGEKDKFKEDLEACARGAGCTPAARGLSWASGLVNDVVKWGIQAAGAAAEWTQDRAEEAADSARRVAADVVNMAKEGWEGAVEFAEAAGEFFNDLWSGAQDAIEEFFGKTLKNLLPRPPAQVCGGIKFPDNVLDVFIKKNACQRAISDIFKEIEEVFKDDLPPLVSAIGARISSMWNDGDLWKAAAGKLASSMGGEKILLDIITGKAGGRAAEIVNTVQEVLTTFFRAHLGPLFDDLGRFFGGILRFFGSLLKNIGKAIVTFSPAGGSSLLQSNSTAAAVRFDTTWYLALCAEIFLLFGFVGGCAYLPWDFSRPTDNDIRLVLEVGGGVITPPLTPNWAPSVDLSGGLKFGPIVTGDRSSLAGLSESVGLELDFEAPEGVPAGLNMGTSFTFATDGTWLTWDGFVNAVIGEGPTVIGPMGGAFVSKQYGWEFIVGPSTREVFNEQNENLNKANSAGGDAAGQSLVQISQGDPNDGALQRRGVSVSYTAAAGAAQGTQLPVVNNQPADEKWINGYLVTSASPLEGPMEIPTLARYGIYAGASCAVGTDVMSEEECRQAGEFLKNAKGRKGTTAFVSGKWGGVPFGCSNQVSSGAFHYQQNVQSDNSRAANDEFRMICRKQFFRGEANQWKCKGGHRIHRKAECVDAYMQLQATLKVDPTNPNERLKRPRQSDAEVLPGGYWWPERVPPLCSVEHDNNDWPTRQHLWDGNYDKPINWGFKQDNHRVLCRKKYFWLERDGALVCPYGSQITNSQVCADAFEALKSSFPNDISPRSLYVLSDPALPPGCSVMAGGDYTPHFNEFASPNAARAASGEFRPMCQQPKHWLGPEKGPCPPGTQILDRMECKLAHQAIRYELKVNPKKIWEEGAFTNLPRGCSVKKDGPETHPLFSTKLQDTAGQVAGVFPICRPARYYIAPKSAGECGSGSEIRNRDECVRAHLALSKEIRRVYGAWRSMGLVTEDIEDGAPRWCSVGGGPDTSAYFNCAGDSLALTTKRREIQGRYRPICKVRVTNVEKNDNSACDPGPPKTRYVLLSLNGWKSLPASLTYDPSFNRADVVETILLCCRDFRGALIYKENGECIKGLSWSSAKFECGERGDRLCGRAEIDPDAARARNFVKSICGVDHPVWINELR
ncbi:MEP1 [Symbiodinium sp. CCMP2592]|nr:MEP1 [Symbiodinium sp. CCMP2592]